jgi:predicted hotdog family 3-hydroxylacyl-ACP dehydratase
VQSLIADLEKISFPDTRTRICHANVADPRTGSNRIEPIGVSESSGYRQKERKERIKFICCESFVNKIKTTKGENVTGPLLPQSRMTKVNLSERLSDTRPAVNISDYSIEDLLPHRGVMLLVGEILEVDELHAVTQSTVDSSWPMADREGVSPLILVELAAQTAGVCNIWERILHEGPGSKKLGWLVAVKRADFYLDHLSIGLSITARAENSHAFDKLREVNSRLYHGDRLLAEVVLQLFQA